MVFSLTLAVAQNIAAYSQDNSVLENNTILIMGICLAIVLVALDQLVSMLKPQNSQPHPSDKRGERVVVYVGILVALAKMLFDYLS